MQDSEMLFWCNLSSQEGFTPAFAKAEKESPFRSPAAVARIILRLLSYSFSLNFQKHPCKARKPGA